MAFLVRILGRGQGRPRNDFRLIHTGKHIIVSVPRTSTTQYRFFSSSPSSSSSSFASSGTSSSSPPSDRFTSIQTMEWADIVTDLSILYRNGIYNPRRVKEVGRRMNLLCQHKTEKGLSVPQTAKLLFILTKLDYYNSNVVNFLCLQIYKQGVKHPALRLKILESLVHFGHLDMRVYHRLFIADNEGHVSPSPDLILDVLHLLDRDEKIDLNLLGLLNTAAERQVAQFSPEQIAQALHFFHQSNWLQPRLLRLMLGRVVDEGLEFPPSHIATIFTVSQQLDYCDLVLLRHLSRQLVASLSEIHVHNIVIALSALAFFDYSDAELMEVVSKKLTHEVKELDVPNFIELLKILQKLDYEDQTLTPALCEYAKTQVRLFSMSDITTVLNSLGLCSDQELMALLVQQAGVFTPQNAPKKKGWRILDWATRKSN